MITLKLRAYSAHEIDILDDMLTQLIRQLKHGFVTAVAKTATSVTCALICNLHSSTQVTRFPADRANHSPCRV